MEKKELNFKDCRDDLLAPGNIYWRKESGVEILISSKADILNFDLLEKLTLSNKILLIEDSIEFKVRDEFIFVFDKYSSEKQMKNKLIWRNSFNSLLRKHYYHSSNSQFELDQLCWSLFSEISRSKGVEFLKIDSDYFKRALSIASSYVICSFLIGYYDESFLINLYNSTINNLMNICNSQEIVSLKRTLEVLRLKTNYTEEDKISLKAIFDINNFGQSFIFEKLNGSGEMSIAKNEMSDLELILCHLNHFYSFESEYHKNILAEIFEGNQFMDASIQNLIKRNFELNLNDTQTA